MKIADTAAATALLMLVVTPFLAQAQQPGKVYRVGFLWESPAALPDGIKSFRQELCDLGWVERQNLVVEYRWGEERYDHLQELAEDLVRLKVDIICTEVGLR